MKLNRTEKARQGGEALIRKHGCAHMSYLGKSGGRPRLLGLDEIRVAVDSKNKGGMISILF
jgi:hypothetical protein